MSNPTSTLTDLVATIATAEMQPTIRQRIDQRLTVLREWFRDGIPIGKGIPSSLTAARLWNDPELGILPINSPNEFTTTHRVHGQLISDVSDLLTALRNRFGRPETTRSPSPKATPNKIDFKAFDRQIQAAVSQWHSERDKRLHETTRADSSDARSLVLLHENSEKDKLIADLRRQLATRAGLRSVE